MSEANFKVNVVVSYTPEGESPVIAPTTRTWSGLTKEEVRSMENTFMSDVIGGFKGLTHTRQQPIPVTDPQTAHFSYRVYEGEKLWTGADLIWAKFGNESQAFLTQQFDNMLTKVSPNIRKREIKRRK